MKAKKNARLILKKETISHLEHGEMTRVKGGDDSDATNCKYPDSMCYCRTIDGICYTRVC